MGEQDFTCDRCGEESELIKRLYAKCDSLRERAEQLAEQIKIEQQDTIDLQEENDSLRAQLKAMQEAMTRVETLQVRMVAALEKVINVVENV